MAENTKIDALNNGTVNISDDVIGIIAGIAAGEIEGIKGLHGTFTDEVMERLGSKNLTKGIQVELLDRTVSVKLKVIVDFGVHIHEVCEGVQENVKTAIESMTGLDVTAVDIEVDGINVV